MTSSSSSSRSRNPSFGLRSTPDPFPSSPTSPYSQSSVSRKSGSGRNPIKVVARYIVGAFVACFTPPEPEGYKKFGVSDEFRTPSVAPKMSRTNSERRGSNRSIYSNPTKEKVPGSMKFTMEEILKATGNFSPVFKIGQGGFGTVYKGRLDDGRFVAIKRAKKTVYDKHLGVEFQSEITTLAQVEHLHLVKFYGYLEHGDERIVVVEYVPNGTLREHLDGVHGKVLDLTARVDIAIDVAHAITYLHMYTDHPIIHRDIKSSNILLTEKLRAKVTDFGFASHRQETYRTETRIKGAGDSKMELQVVKKFNEGDAISALDPRLQLTTGTNLAIENILELALQCLAPRRQNRPSMRRCGEILWSIRKDYRELSAMDLRSYSSNSQQSGSVGGI
ncbi:hypothetical protein V6N11_006940 [Hibiscus sabdariffa]|uniref:Protein kinase domain-containing protein n=1 Tax=Hibiscus sabdariffa TaxID=183260 RepID=A0ABR2RSW9_9ROSI